MPGRVRLQKRYLWSKLCRPPSSSGDSARAAKSGEEPSAWLNSRTYDSRGKVSIPGISEVTQSSGQLSWHSAGISRLSRC